MRQKRIMVLSGQIEILVVLEMWVYSRRLFLWGGDILSPCGSRNLEGNPKGSWEANINPMYVHPDQHLGQSHYWRFPFSFLCTST